MDPGEDWRGAERMSVASFLEEFVRWVEQREGVLAAALVGSHARGTARPDSDVYVVILSTQRDALVKGDWTSVFGEVASRTLESYGAIQSVRVSYGSGLEVEFSVAEPDWARVPLDAGTKTVLAAGARALYDPRRLLARAIRAAERDA